MDEPNENEILEALQQARGNKTLAAERLRISRDQLNWRLKRMKDRPSDDLPPSDKD